jgi:hypothetical protein
VLKEEWVTQSIQQGSWADIEPFLHPAFNRPVDPDFQGVFSGKTVCVMESVNPPGKALIQLVQAAGGLVTTPTVTTKVDIVLFGKPILSECSEQWQGLHVKLLLL